MVVRDSPWWNTTGRQVLEVVVLLTADGSDTDDKAVVATIDVLDRGESVRATLMQLIDGGLAVGNPVTAWQATAPLRITGIRPTEAGLEALALRRER